MLIAFSGVHSSCYWAPGERGLRDLGFSLHAPHASRTSSADAQPTIRAHRDNSGCQEMYQSQFRRVGGSGIISHMCCHEAKWTSYLILANRFRINSCIRVCVQYCHKIEGTYGSELIIIRRVNRSRVPSEPSSSFDEIQAEKSPDPLRELGFPSIALDRSVGIGLGRVVEVSWEDDVTRRSFGRRKCPAP